MTINTIFIATYRVKQSQLERKNDAMRYLDVAIVLFHVFETLQMQRQNHGQLLDAHPFLGLLVAAAVVALELVVAAQRLCVAEASQTVCDARVLVNVYLQVEKVLVFAADRFAVEATRFAGQNSLEYFVHPRWFV